MKKRILILICILMLNGCKYFRGDNCNNTKSIIGTYSNVYDKEAKNILIINKNGTFEQIFTKEGIVKKNNGTWKFFEKSCDIYLNNLKLLHKVPKQYEKYFLNKGVFRINKIMFNEDLRKQFDFLKE